MITRVQNQAVRTITDNCRALKFKTHGFEKGRAWNPGEQSRKCEAACHEQPFSEPRVP